MNYYINPLAFTGIFAVPNSVVDDNIRLASALQLKTLLYMLRHSSEGRISTEELSKAIGYGEEDISDALIFWEERGLVVKDGSAPAAPVTAITEAAPLSSPPPATGSLLPRKVGSFLRRIRLATPLFRRY